MAKKQMTEQELFVWKNNTLSERYQKVEPMEFYRELFPEGSLGVPGDPDVRKPNMIVATCVRKPDEEIRAIEAKEKAAWDEYEERRARGEHPKRPRPYKREVVSNRLVFDDFAGLEELIQNDHELLKFVIIPPVAFSGKNRTKENGYHAWAITIDLDGVEEDQLLDLLHQIDNEVVPEPTYLVNSGHGMHLYYCFEDPIPLYPYIKTQMTELKKVLSDCVWNHYTSTIPSEKREYQSIVQGYRAVGSCSKLGKDYRITAFQVGRKTTLQYLMDWATESGRVDYDEFEHITIDQAREQWPEWYQRRIVEGKGRPPFKFKHKGVYKSWLRRMEFGAFDGNRYNCIAVLFALAYKTEGIEYEDVMEDALNLVPRLNRLTRKAKNEFTTDDVLAAAAYFDEGSQTLGLKTVYRMTKIHIKPNKRNKNNKYVHLALARNRRDVLCSMRGKKDWREGNGRPTGSGTAQAKVQQYRSEHPEASVTEVARALGISRPTVYKWWDGEANPTYVKKVPARDNSSQIDKFDWRAMLENATGLSMAEIKKLIEKEED